MLVNGQGVDEFTKHILPAMSAAVKANQSELDQLDKEIENALQSMQAPSKARKSEGDQKGKPSRIVIIPRESGRNEGNTIRLETSKITQPAISVILRESGKINKEDLTSNAY